MQRFPRSDIRAALARVPQIYTDLCFSAASLIFLAGNPSQATRVLSTSSSSASLHCCFMLGPPLLASTCELLYLGSCSGLSLLPEGGVCVLLLQAALFDALQRQKMYQDSKNRMQRDGGS